jgi:hypothetical protein
MGDPIAIGALLTQGIKREFALVYTPRYRGVMDRIGGVVWLEVTSDKVSELYGFLNAAIYPVRWDPGNVIGAKSILSVQFRVPNRDFGRRVYLPRDYEDDQTGTVFAVARALGTNWATLSERIFYQIMTAGTDNDLLPNNPNSADGNALYLTSTRYGSSSGNVVSVTGTTTVQDVITDIFGVKRRLIEFQNTESQPFWDPTDVDRGLTIFHGTATTLVMEQARAQITVPLAASTATSNAGVSNVLQNTSYVPTFSNSQRITNSRYYCFLNGVDGPQRPLFRQVRKAMTEAQGNWSNSDIVRDQGEQYVQFDSREGWGSALAIGTVRVS